MERMERRVERSRYFRFDDSYLRVRRERLLGDISGRRLTHPGLAGFPNTVNATPKGGRDVGGMPAPSVDARMLAAMRRHFCDD